MTLLRASDLKRLYENATGRSWNPEDGVPWLMGRYEALDIDFKDPILRKSAHVTLSDKANWLTQRFCTICYPQCPILTLPIRIKPESWQSLDSLNKAAFKAALGQRLSSKSGIAPDKRVCLSLLFVCSSSRRVRDVDNMAKLTIDAIKGYVMGDDRSIDHLTLIRLDHAGTEEYLTVHISNSNLNDHSDVVHDQLQHGWAGAEPLRLEDFIDLDAK